MPEYYRIAKQKLYNLLKTSPEKGLTSRVVRKKRKKHGVNKLPGHDGKKIITIFINQFQDFMIVVLMAATLLSFFMGEISDAITIFAIIILNTIMGFVQEYRAEKSLSALKKLTSPTTKIIRNNELGEIKAHKLVPGDLIILETGDKVPADARIIETENLEVNESILTGESTPVSKSEELLYPRNISLQNQTNIVFMGSTVTRGEARAVVIRTGTDTEMGKIAGMLSKDNKNITPLQKRLKHLGKWLVMASIIITLLIVVIGIFNGQSTYQMFMAGVSLAVAAIPEGLPAIVTLVLAIGVQKMINKNAIVRHLPSVETLGCATVICSDKTGTLTENKMTLSHIYINGKIKNTENIYEQKQKNKNIKKMMEIGALCNGAKLKKEEKTGTLQKMKKIFTGSKPPALLGDPTDKALIKAMYNYDMTLKDLKDKYDILARKPFESKNKRMSILINEKKENKKELWVKGAPETILDLSKYILINGKKVKINSSLKKEILKANNEMAQKALRVLAIAYKPLFQSKSKNKINNDIDKNEDELVLLGLTGLIDPPRPEAYSAVKKCKKAGIKPIMITGDHKITAKVIAEKLDILDINGKITTGKELKKMSDQELKEEVLTSRVFARISPEDKLKIVKALKQQGEVVAMTGDGVNDAPAVKEADIGIGMGKSGTDVTREVSSLILSDDNFATIVAAIKQGREIYNNIRKFIRYLLSCNIGELLAIFLGITLGLPLPLIPIQILWVNLVTDGLPALALGMEENSDNVMEKPPRQPQESIFADGMAGRIFCQGILIGLSTMLVFLIGLYRLQAGTQIARTMAFSTLVFSQLFFVFSCRSEIKSLWEYSPFGNKYIIGAVMISVIMQLLVIYHPFLNNIFRTHFLNTTQWVIIFILSIWSTVLLEIIHHFLLKSKK